MKTTVKQLGASQQLKSEIRARVRRQRRSLSELERKQADRRICANIQRLPAYHRAKVVAVFLAFDGEPSVSSLIARRSNNSKLFVVPVIRADRMRFVPLQTLTQLRKNRFGIAEPTARRRVSAMMIDIVFVPLVAFDMRGRRLGMGGGYYDRYFSYLLERKQYRRPKLFGVAYEFQQLDDAPNDPWDVPLDGVVTDQKICYFQGENQT